MLPFRKEWISLWTLQKKSKGIETCDSERHGCRAVERRAEDATKASALLFAVLARRKLQFPLERLRNRFDAQVV